jgi:hypothetical protein
VLPGNWGIADPGFLAFKLKPEFAIGTVEITSLGVVHQTVKGGRRTIRTIKILRGTEGNFNREIRGTREIRKRIEMATKRRKRRKNPKLPRGI